MLLGLLAAAIAGLVTYVAIILTAQFLEFSVAALAFNKEWEDLRVYQTLQLYGVFGLPLSLILSVVVGLPVWEHAEARQLRTSRDAVAWGAIVGAIIGLLFLALEFLMGLRIYFDVDSSFNSYRWGHQVNQDGMPTLLGWVLELLDVLYVALAGAVAGLAARWAALPKGEKT
jgi:ABC-type amino acid transport system permease subunit